MYLFFFFFFTVLEVNGKREIKSILLHFIFYKAYLKIEGFVVKLFLIEQSKYWATFTV